MYWSLIFNNRMKSTEDAVFEIQFEVAIERYQSH